MLNSFKAVDFYRKLKRDLQAELTETSFAGAALSIFAAVVMLALIFAELNSFLAIQEESKVVLDQITSVTDDTLQININITFHRLKCEYASVDVTNFMGTHDAEMAARVQKVHLNKAGLTTMEHPDRPAVQHSTDEEHDGSMTTELLTELTFEARHHTHQIMIVNFFAPWCHWCQRLAPVWEKAAQALAQHHPGDTRLALTRVDCTAEGTAALCAKFGIDAFPSILVFRKDDQGDTSHESYHGARSVLAIGDWAENLLAQERLEVPKTRTVDVDRDGVAESHDGVGCVVSAMLHVQKAPGMFRVEARSEGHNFNWETMDVSHTVNHVSFGPFLKPEAWAVLPEKTARSVGTLDGKSFTSDQQTPTTHEHYIKVVRHQISPLPSKGPPVSLFGYVAHSNNIQKTGEVPTVRFSYEILPIVVQISESRQALYHFATQLCAIVGGVFTVAGIVATMLSKTADLVSKKGSLGKLG